MPPDKHFGIYRQARKGFVHVYRGVQLWMPE